MKTLPLKLWTNEFNYTKVARTDKKAIYYFVGVSCDDEIQSEIEKKMRDE